VCVLGGGGGGGGKGGGECATKKMKERGLVCVCVEIWVRVGIIGGLNGWSH